VRLRRRRARGLEAIKAVGRRCGVFGCRRRRRLCPGAQGFAFGDEGGSGGRNLAPAVMSFAAGGEGYAPGVKGFAFGDVVVRTCLDLAASRGSRRPPLWLLGGSRDVRRREVSGVLTVAGSLKHTTLLAKSRRPPAGAATPTLTSLREVVTRM